MHTPRRILVHDFGGHAFPLQLSRALAQRGHTVRHVYCASLVNRPSGGLARAALDPARLDVHGIGVDEPLAKYSLLKRWQHERRYGRRLALEAAAFAPDTVLSGCAPPEVQRQLLASTRRSGARFVGWVQDLFGLAARLLLKDRVPPLGALVGRHYDRLDRALLATSDALIAVTPDFVPVLRSWSVPACRLHTIENWAPIDDLPVLPRHNAWSRAMGLDDKRTLLYAGCLGLKHDPSLLLALARGLRDLRDVEVLVVSQGLGADWLRRESAALGLTNLRVLDFEPLSRVPEMLASADVLVGVLKPDAARFSVPSKVLTYLCAGRPVLLAVPPANLAARTVLAAAAGAVVPPRDPAAFVAAAHALLASPARRAALGGNARRYAERRFSIAPIADAFERVLCRDAPARARLATPLEQPCLPVAAAS